MDRQRDLRLPRERDEQRAGRKSARIREIPSDYVAGVAVASAGSPVVPVSWACLCCSAASWFLRSWTLLYVLSCKVGCGGSCRAAAC